MVRGGVEPPTHGFSVDDSTQYKNDVSGCESSKCEPISEEHEIEAQRNAQLFGRDNITDDDLAAVVDAWPMLPDAIRLKIGALVDEWRAF